MAEAGWFLPLLNFVFMPNLDMRYGNILRYPYQPCDSAQDQPFFFIQYLYLVRSVFLEHLQEMNKNNPSVD
jgi:hypothetical protein